MNADHHGMSRRTFIAWLSTALATSWLAPAGLRGADFRMLRKVIPSSGESLAVIGLGTSRTLDVGTDSAARSELTEILRTFLAGGGELIDSSPMYGSAEQVLGELLQRVGDHGRLFAATKVWIDGEQAGIRQMETSLAQWGLKRFDLMQVHNLRDWKSHLKTLRKWQQDGRIRYVGMTTSHGRFHRELEEILRTEPLDFVQFSYNLGNLDAERRLLPLAADRGVAVIINRPYQRGALFTRVKGQVLPDWAADFDAQSWGQFFLKFIAAHPAVTCVIPATSKVRHLRDNLAAGFGRLPDAGMRRRMQAYFETL